MLVALEEEEEEEELSWLMGEVESPRGKVGGEVLFGGVTATTVIGRSSMVCVDDIVVGVMMLVSRTWSARPVYPVADL